MKDVIPHTQNKLNVVRPSDILDSHIDIFFFVNDAGKGIKNNNGLSEEQWAIVHWHEENLEWGKKIFLPNRFLYMGRC